MRTTLTAIIMVVFYLILLCSQTLSFEASYNNGKKFKFKLKGWYK